MRGPEAVDSRVWGGRCTAWDLLDRPGLRVTEEHMPAGTEEVLHVHDRAWQAFYVLSGQLAIELETGVLALPAGRVAEVSPGEQHRVVNDGPEDLRFVVISAPSTRGDRR